MILTEIKIGRETYQIKEGDYILDNGACHQLCSGDGRVLKRKGWDAYRHLVIPKSTVKKVLNPILPELDKVTQNGLTKYYLK